MAYNITQTFVKKLEPPECGNRRYYDGGYKDKVKGFGVRITAKGSKSFILRYLNKDRAERIYTLGDVPKTIQQRPPEKRRVG